MAKKKIKVQAEYVFEIEIDTESSYVKDYDSEEGMVEDLFDNHFSGLPVINNGVGINYIEGGFEIVE